MQAEIVRSSFLSKLPSCHLFFNEQTTRATQGDDNYVRRNKAAMMTRVESVCLIYRWPCLKALQTPTETPAGVREKERERERGMRQAETGRVWGRHIPCSRGKEMHGHALFSKACLVLFMKERGFSSTRLSLWGRASPSVGRYSLLWETDSVQSHQNLPTRTTTDL